jgi:hypothetical protein
MWEPLQRRSRGSGPGHGDLVFADESAPTIAKTIVVRIGAAAVAVEQTVDDVKIAGAAAHGIYRVAAIR